MKICTPIIATGKYSRFVPKLVASMQQFFVVGKYEVTPIVLTDSNDPMPGVVRKTPCLGWPGSTLKRYHVLLEHRELIEQFDFVLHLDADLRFVAPVEEEVIGYSVGVLSPVGYDWPKERLPFERRPESRACVPEGQGERYYGGSINGGYTDQFLAMAEAVVEGVNEDEKNGILAKFHEESHLNKFYVEHPPQVTLPPSYLWPETSTLKPDYTKPIIMTLVKKDIDKLKL